METDPRTWIAALRGSHERLAGLAAKLSPANLGEPSYCADWTIAQVLSHLGSGAEIALMLLPGALGEAEPVGREAFGPVWERWDARTPERQAADALEADEAHVAALERLTGADLAKVSLPFFGMKLDAVGMVRLRLGEHAVHTWDVEVAADPSARLAQQPASLLIDGVPGGLAARLGKPSPEPFSARLRTTGPDRDYLLSADGSVTMTDWPGGLPVGQGPAGTEVRLPAEALLRLVYGRLDPGHTPSDVVADPAALGTLRMIFPGF